MPDNHGEVGQPTEQIKQLPIEVLVSVGRAHPKIADLLNMECGQVLSLDRSVDDTVELYVGDRIVARGELQELEQNGRLGVKLTEILTNTVST